MPADFMQGRGEGVTMAGTDLPWGEMLASAAGGGGLAQLVAWWNGRAKRNAYTMGAVDHAVETAMRVVTDRLETVERQHTACEASLREVRDDVDGLRRERADLKAEIDRLMAGPVARYSPQEIG